LVRMVTATTTGPEQRIEFTYDWRGRRIGKKVWDNTAGSGSPEVDLRFIYDGWNLIAELDTAGNVPRQYMWGLDLSGSLPDRPRGAGGVGGLVKFYDAATAKHYFPAFDGNGNVMGLVREDKTIQAQYEYGPFGEPIRVSGPMADVNPIRFSTKCQDDDTDLVMYPCRSFRDGRFLNRDPIGEAGGDNLYGFVNNNAELFQ